MEYTEFFKRIKQQIDPVYLFFGAEEFVKEKALKMLISQAVPDDLSSMNAVTLEGNASADAICEQCDTVPFMSERKLVVVQNFSVIMSKSKNNEETETREDPALNRLYAYLEKPSPSTCLVFYCKDGADKRKKLFKTLQKHTVVEFKALDANEVAKWIEREVKAAGKRIDGQALHFLMEYTDTRLEFLSGEMNKLLHYTEEDEAITADMIRKVVTPLRDYNIFKMADAILEKRPDQAVRLLAGLLSEKEEPLYILGGISRQMRLALRTYLLRREKASKAEMLGSLGIPEFALTKLLRQISQYDEKSLKAALDMCIDADEGIKTGRYLPEIILYILVTKLSSLSA